MLKLWRVFLLLFSKLPKIRDCFAKSLKQRTFIKTSFLLIPNKTYTVSEATKKLEHYCAYQERCYKEVQKKLYEMRMIPEVIDQILLHLSTNNFLDESRFAQAFARGKFKNKKWGKQRIVRELKFRKISKYNIQLALKEISESDYFATFHTLAEKRFKQVASEKNLQKKRKKLADYLLYRGWESSLVYDKVRELVIPKP